MPTKSMTIKGVPDELKARLRAQADKETKGYMKVQFHQFIIMLLETAITEREGEGK